MVSARAGAPARPQPVAGTVALLLVAVGALGLAVGVGLALLHAGPPSRAVASPLHGEATWPAGARPAPALTGLRDQTGQPFSLASLHGHTAVVAFLDSHCTAACPLEGRALAAAEQSLARNRRPVLVAVSVNPADTPASARAAIRKWGLGALGAWHWMTGPKAALARAWRAYRIFVQIPAHGDIVHTEALYLLDRSGDERSGYVYPFAPAFVRGDLALLASGRVA